MGPIRSISGLIEDARGQTAEIATLIVRLRAANRHLTGSDGSAPTPLGANQGEASSAKIEKPPLMIQLTTALAKTDAAIADLRNEVAYLEQHSETSQSEKSVTAGEWTETAGRASAQSGY